MPYSSAVAPQTHACDVDDLDYSKVADGFIRCTVCPRSWKLIISFNGFTKWVNSCEVRMPVDHVDWLAGMKPYPAPTEEEIVANRQKRLDMLDQVQRDRMHTFNDLGAGLDWLQKLRGAGGKVDREWVEERFANPEPEKPVQRRTKRRNVSVTITGSIHAVRAALDAIRKMNP